MATILIVDDDRACREMLRRALQLDQHVVAEAQGAKEGYALARLLNPDLIVTDYRMGRDGSGVDLTRWLRLEGEVCPILFWSAADQVRELALAAGANGYLVKGKDSLAMLRQAVEDSSQPVALRVVKGA